MDQARVLARKKEFKTPPTRRLSQQARREQALEEQKRRRLGRIDASRQLEHFADLNLGLSDDEVDNEDGPEVDGSEAKAEISEKVELINGSDEAEQYPQVSSIGTQLEGSEKPHSRRAKKGKSKGKRRPSKWANKCMYAELLEMHPEALWTDNWNINGTGQLDGLPGDLETSWVGLAPVPLGKRCLAVTMQSAGVSGIVPNTILRSRLLGKVLLRPFPSPLPLNTILDCILDENWQSNGILHVLDVIRWKSQDVGGCEAKFRFWWRDTRLSEIPAWPPPYPHKASFPSAEGASVPIYRFPYPTTFIPVPYAAPTTYELLLDDLLLRARNGRGVRARVPILSANMCPGHVIDDEDMQIDQPVKTSSPRGTWSCDQVQEAEVRIMSDGMLLYVAEASYDSGESPLSVWVPRTAFDGRAHAATNAVPAAGPSADATLLDEQQSGSEGSPLDLFER